MKRFLLGKIKDLQLSWLSILQISHVLISTGFVSILYLYFVKHQLNVAYIVLAEALGYAAAVFFIVIKKQCNLRRDIQIGFLLVIIGMLSLLLAWPPLVILFVYTVLRLSGGIIFFIPYNILFFGPTQADKKLHKMATYWAVVSIAGILAPLLGAYIFSRFNLLVFVGLAVSILCVALCFTIKLTTVRYGYSLKEIFVAIKGTRIITMFDGALQVASQLIITLYLLTFIQDELTFGRILSINALFSIFFSLKVAKISDESNKRIQFMWPLALISAAIMVFFYASQDFWTILFLIVLFKFITTLFNPIRSNIVLDTSTNTAVTWLSRELY